MNKSHYLIGALLFGVATQTLAQTSFVTFANTVVFDVPADRRVYEDFVGGTPLIGTNWFAQLYYGSDPATLIPVAGAPTRFRAPSTSVPGTWVGVTRTLDGFAQGQPMLVEVRVWDGSLFPTFEAAVAGGGVIGVSGPFEYVHRLSFPPHPQDTLLHNLRAFALQRPVNQPPVPALTIGPLLLLTSDQTELQVLSVNGSNAVVQLDASATTDVDSPTLEFVWQTGDPPETFATGVLTSHIFAVGEHVVTLVVSDGTSDVSLPVAFTVVSVSDALRTLAAMVEESALEAAQKPGLVAKLNAAAVAFENMASQNRVELILDFLEKFDSQLGEIGSPAAVELQNAVAALKSAVEQE